LDVIKELGEEPDDGK